MNKVFLTNKMVMFCISLILFSATIVQAQVIISEVLYDPVNTETGGEAVELYNPTSSDIDISGYQISTPSSVADATLPTNAIIKAESFFLVADSGFSENKDNPNGNDADYEEAITLKNTDGGVALLDDEGTILDAVGWGNEENIESTFYEGTPAGKTTAGQSLARIDLEDSDNNENDFEKGIPFFQSSAGSGNVITLQINILEESTSGTIHTIQINDEDTTTSEIDILPLPKSTKTVSISAIISSSQEIDEVSLNWENNEIEMIGEEINETAKNYTGELTLEFYDEPGTYNVEISATIGDEQIQEEIEFNYVSLTGIEIDANILECTPVANSCQMVGDKSLSTNTKPTLRNIGNTMVDVEIYGDALASSSSSFSIESVEYTFADDFSTEPILKVSEDPLLTNLDLFPGENALQELSLRLTVPSGTPKGEYVGRIYLFGVESQ